MDNKMFKVARDKVYTQQAKQAQAAGLYVGDSHYSNL
jgi:hypothetical protein